MGHGCETQSRDQTRSYLHEVGILTGYRLEHQPWSYYFRSVISWNNETLNVWTHGVGALLVTFAYFYYNAWITSENAKDVLLFYLLCCIVTDLTSATIHAIHSKSPTIHYVSVMFDYIGVALYPFGTTTIAMYCGTTTSIHLWLRHIFLPLNFCITTITNLGVALAKVVFSEPHQKFKRKLAQTCSCFGMVVLVALLWMPRYYSCYGDAKCSISSLNHISVVIALLIFMGVMYSMLFPERSWPGRFDIVGHSHQWFHALGSLNQILQIRTIYIDASSGNSDISCQISEAHFKSLLLSLLSQISIGVTIVYILYRFVALQKIKHKIK